MKNIIAVFSVIILLSALTVSVQAQDGERVGFRGWGPRLGVTIDPDQFHFGAHLDFGNFAQRVRFQPNFELGIGDDLLVGTINLEAAFRFRENWNVWTPYAGGGLGIVFVDRDNDNGFSDDTNTELGVNVLGGIEKGISDGDRFFIEVKLGLADSPDFKTTVGWTFF